MISLMITLSEEFLPNSQERAEGIERFIDLVQEVLFTKGIITTPDITEIIVGIEITDEVTLISGRVLGITGLREADIIRKIGLTKKEKG